MKNTRDYREYRVVSLASDSTREFLGAREIATLLEVLVVNGRPSSIKDLTVLDLGCGDQHLRIPTEVNGATYYGIDAEDCDLETDRYPFQERSVDIVTMLSVIEHLHDPSHMLAEVRRVLKTDGLLWIETPNIEYCRESFWDDPTHVHPYTRRSIRTLLEISKFDVLTLAPNYRCKPARLYADTPFNFFRARYLMPFSGTSTLPVPKALKGGCSGIFVLARPKF